MRRAAISIPQNIAEGYGRRNIAEYQQFLFIGYGSLLELETQLLLATDLRYMQKNKTIDGPLKEVGSILYRMLHPLAKS